MLNKLRLFYQAVSVLLLSNKKIYSNDKGTFIEASRKGGIFFTYYEVRTLYRVERTKHFFRLVEINN